MVTTSKDNILAFGFILNFFYLSFLVIFSINLPDYRGFSHMLIHLYYLCQLQKTSLELRRLKV